LKEKEPTCTVEKEGMGADGKKGGRGEITYVEERSSKRIR
jgi:hypothetical protein